MTAGAVELTSLGSTVGVIQTEISSLWDVMYSLGLVTTASSIGGVITAAAGLGTLASTYLPFSAGSTKKLSGDLYIGSSSGASGKNLIVYGSSTGPQVQIGDGSAATNNYTLKIGQYTLSGTQINNLLTNAAG